MHRTPLYIYIIECTLFLLLCSCKGQGGARSVEEIKAELHIDIPDTTLYGTLSSLRGDSLVLTSQYDETTSCSITEARSRQQILGSLTEGNRYAVLLSPEAKSAQQVINLTELSGQWFYDMDQQRGFNLTTAGAMSSINPDEVSFRKWRIYNGRIILYYIGKEHVVRNSRQFLTDTTEITHLTADELELTFRGKQLHCRRQTEAIKVDFNF